MIKNSDKSTACVSCSCSNHSTWAYDCSSQTTEIIWAWETYTVQSICYQELALFLACLSSILKDLCDFCQFSSQSVLSTHCGLSVSLNKEHLSWKQSCLTDLKKSAHTSQSIIQHLHSVYEPTGTVSLSLLALLVTLSTLNLSSHLQKTFTMSSQDDTIISAIAHD